AQYEQPHSDDAALKTPTTAHFDGPHDLGAGDLPPRSPGAGDGPMVPVPPLPVTPPSDTPAPAPKFASPIPATVAPPAPAGPGLALGLVGGHVRDRPRPLLPLGLGRLGLALLLSGVVAVGHFTLSFRGGFGGGRSRPCPGRFIRSK